MDVVDFTVATICIGAFGIVKLMFLPWLGSFVSWIVGSIGLPLIRWPTGSISSSEEVLCLSRGLLLIS